MQSYSTIVVVDSLLKTEEIEKTIDQIERSIKNNGGEILEIDRWGKKRLAYVIKKRQYGYYVEITFKADGNAIKVIEQEYRLDENILRYLTIKLNKKILQQKEKIEQEINDRQSDIMEQENDHPIATSKNDVKKNLEKEIAVPVE